MSFLPDEQSSRQRFSSFPAIWELGLAVRKKTPRDGDLLQAQRAQRILTRPLDLSETRLIGEVVGSLPVDECSPMLGRGLVLLCVLNTQ